MFLFQRIEFENIFSFFFFFFRDIKTYFINLSSEAWNVLSFFFFFSGYQNLFHQFVVWSVLSNGAVNGVREVSNHAVVLWKSKSNNTSWFNSLIRGLCEGCMSENKPVYLNDISRVIGKRAFTIYTNSKGSGEPAHPRSLARTYPVRPRKWQAKGRPQRPAVSYYFWRF